MRCISAGAKLFHPWGGEGEKNYTNMRYSKVFGKTTKTISKDEVAVNAQLLLRGGFIDKLMAGSYTLLPLGFRVKEKIEQVIREEMNSTGAQEMLMPLLHPKNIWNETGRWEKAREVMYQFKKNDKEYALSFTHEEIVLDVIRKHINSYKDLPIKIYHFSTKFRDELRARSGILRGREFIMKDLYSAHTSKEDLDDYYFKVADAYMKVFHRFGLDAKMVEAGGGVFTDEHTHEFQVLNSSGEDTIYYCNTCDFAQNDEIATVKEGDTCPKCSGEIKSGKSIEVGNIFRFGTTYSEKMNVTYNSEKGIKEHVYLGSYGIGITRMIGVLAETFHDERGLLWSDVVAPFQVHLVGLGNIQEIVERADEVYKMLMDAGVEVLYDDREGVGAGEKFADADLIGIPVRLVVSAKSGEQVELKKRNEKETKLLAPQEIILRLRR